MAQCPRGVLYNPPIAAMRQWNCCFGVSIKRAGVNERVAEMQVAILILIGLSAGMSSGLFGIGGGVLIVPALVYLLDFPMHRAIGTSLAVLLPPIGAAAVYAYYRAGHIDWQAAVILAGTVFIGAWLGAMVATNLNENWLRNLFGVFLIALGCYTLFFSKPV